MSRRKHIDGEEEQLDLLEPIVRSAMVQIAKSPSLDTLHECLMWVAREAFRLGYQHAHSRSTEPVPGLVDPPDE